MLNRTLLAVLASLSLNLPAHATSVLPLFLDEIVDTAAVAFEGTVTGNRSTRDASGHVVTFTTFTVGDVLKGDVAATYTIKQIGGDLPAEGLRYKVHSIPRFTAGQSYVVFLYGVSGAGFSSPVGLEQGRFEIVSGDAGPQVTNGRDFREMSERVADRASAATQAKLRSVAPVRTLGLDEFKKMVRDRAGDRAGARVERSEQ